MNLVQRPRRLRTTKAMRALVAETRVSPQQLIYPAFVRAGISEPQPISAMPGQYQHTLDSIRALACELASAGVGGVDLFGVPTQAEKDACGSNAWHEEGILNQAISAIRQEVGDALVVCADTCLDEFTDHGHCGIVTSDGVIDNDATLPLYAKMALSQARAGAHMVSPSGMMDGQVGYIRQALDAAGFTDVAIMAYSAKYASAFFGPFRDAVGSTLTGDRKTYQQDPANRKEGLREALLDIAEGADIVMVKPASHYLDVVTDVAAAVEVPVAAYQVSGEYAMLEAAAANGWIDRENAIAESLVSIARAGADVILSYWALEAAQGFALECGTRLERSARLNHSTRLDRSTVLERGHGIAHSTEFGQSSLHKQSLDQVRTDSANSPVSKSVPTQAGIRASKVKLAQDTKNVQSDPLEYGTGESE